MSEEYPERYQIIQDYLEQAPHKQITYTSEQRRSKIAKGTVHRMMQ